jgi:hypothetical protein
MCLDFTDDLTTPIHVQIENEEKSKKKEVVLNERCDFVDLLLRYYLFH